MLRSEPFTIPGQVSPSNLFRRSTDRAAKRAAEMSVRRIRLGGVAVDLCGVNDVTRLVERALSRELASQLLVGSVNLDHVHQFGPRRDSARRAVGEAENWLMLIDGMPLAWAAQRATTGERHPRLAGSDLLPDLLRVAERGEYRVGFVGGTEAARDGLATALAQQYPQLSIAGHWLPSRFDVTDQAASELLADELRGAGVDILVVGLGKPLQELWVELHGGRTGAKVVLAFGAAADFLAGTVPRAPGWVRTAGLEWLFRLSREPRRLRRRYLVEGPRALADLIAGAP